MGRVGRMGRAPFSQFSLCKVLPQPRSRHEGGKCRRPGRHGQSPGGRADRSTRAPAHPCTASHSAILAPAAPAQALARSAVSGHVWKHHLSRTTVFKAKESTVGRSCPSPGVFPSTDPSLLGSVSPLSARKGANAFQENGDS